MKLPETAARKEIPKNVRFRLLVSLPVILTVFTLASGLLAINIIRSTTSISLPTMKLLLTVGGIMAITIIACISGIILAYAITKPLKKLTITAESFISEGENKSAEIKAFDEIGILTAVFHKAYFSINKLVKDSHILDNLPEGIISIDSKGEVTELNRTAAKLLELDPDKVKGKFFQEAFPSEEGNNSFLLFLEKGLREREIPFQEVKISLPGKRSSTFWTRVSPSGNDMLVVLKDLKTVKNIRDQLRKAEQLAALGTLASGVAHEVRNPLGSLRGLTELISEDLSPDDPKRLYTENMLKEIDRLNHLVEDILNFAQNPMSSLEPTDISQILSHCISLARYNFPDKNITVKEIHQPGLPLIQADQERLIQVFLNIMGNAFEASPDKGRIEVESKESRERGNLIVTISDSGPGITTESLPLVFDPFYTTKEKGTGLGLSIAQNIITAYGGSMEVESVPGQGATFSVVLPISAETEAQKYKSTGK